MVPLVGEKGDDLLTPADVLVAVAPLGVEGVGAGDALGVTAVPGVLGGLDLGEGGLVSEGRKWWARLIRSAHVPILPGRGVCSPVKANRFTYGPAMGRGRCGMASRIRRPRAVQCFPTRCAARSRSTWVRSHARWFPRAGLKSRRVPRSARCRSAGPGPDPATAPSGPRPGPRCSA